MALINSNQFVKKSKIKAVVSAEIVAQIQEYCQWANIDDVGFFIEEAACFVFAKDKSWKDHQRSIKRTSKNKAAETAGTN